MKIGLLIIAHSCIGDELLHTAEAMLGVCPLNVTTIMVPTDFDTDTADAQAMDAIDLLDQGKGVLVLTDMYGSTPSNIAHRLAKEGHVNVVAGINLPMLIRILNYPTLDLEELTEKALSGGREGVIFCRAKHD
ncbi:MAG TPA: PTS fructose transporter subunit IIA [Chromatiaceae bacterium]|jgi:PTS system ascorbate-specific IIA component|nr:PTS fructose transporter subunit IIA [Chromatiaceae bacterium]HIB83726.1 PTS fructose transporter subunit IIA [Chromatiaceae bacterium]HIN83027.1 PTS fructose transporter subunit IIA [Chromatiales bacterium]HIO14798.1 PTS fructose transporter subunit IIA [Chromatiales bacterium]HIO54349.1 PTS fructose transporter subunit IIA [Chromatiales bacterium]